MRSGPLVTSERNSTRTHAGDFPVYQNVCVRVAQFVGNVSLLVRDAAGSHYSRLIPNELFNGPPQAR